MQKYGPNVARSSKLSIGARHPDFYMKSEGLKVLVTSFNIKTHYVDKTYLQAESIQWGTTWQPVSDAEM